MANTVRIKRRASGLPGAPSVLENAELAFNEVDEILYYGKGSGGLDGTATTIEAIGGSGAFLTLTTPQTVSGVKTFSQTIVGNIDTASKLLTSRTIALSGDVAGSVSFDGSANVTITTTIQPNAVTLGTDTVGNYVAAIAGTANQVTVSGSGSEGAAVVLSLPQNIHTAATPTFAGLDVNGGRITSVADPITDDDAANKRYVDSAVQGFDPKQSVLVATTDGQNLDLFGLETIDGITVTIGDRVLVKNQTNPAENGIYEASSDTWLRTADANTWEKLVSAYVFVEDGTNNKEMGYLCSVDEGGTLGTTDVTWIQFTGAGQVIAGTGLTKDGNTLNVGAGTGITVDSSSVALTGQALALHNLATNGFFVRDGSSILARSIAVSGDGISISNGDGVAANPTITLSTPLAVLGTLTAAADKLAYYSGASSAALTDFTAFGRSLIGVVDAAAGRTVLGLGSIATQNANDVAITGGTIDGIVIDCGTY